MTDVFCPNNSSISVILVIDIIATIFAVVGLCASGWFIWRKHYQLREYRTKLGPILQDCFWTHETEIRKVLQRIDGLKKRFLFREITQFHVLAYKYRIEPENSVECSNTCTSILQQIAHVQHFFERLQLEFSLQGSCPQYMSVCLKQTIEELGLATIELWSDNRIQVLKSVERYFCSSSAISEKWMSDSQLKSLIEPMVPYVGQLCMSDKCTYFVLGELHLETVTSTETASKIRCIDTVLSTNDPSLGAKRKALVDIYNTAREICLNHNYITNQSHLPEIPPADQPDSVSIHDVVMYVLHLLRVLCMEKNLTELYADDTFLTLLFHLYHNVCGGVDPNIQQQVIERIKKNIDIHLRNLAEQLGTDAESTRIRLENVERDLLRHLTLPQIQQDPKLRRKNLLATHRNTTAKSFESEASVYTMALSASAFALQRQGTFESDLSNYQSQKFLAQQTSAEMLSAPSVYDTAPSSHMSSANENTPLISNTPPTPLSSSSPDQIEGRNHRPQSPMSVDSDYYETAV